MQGLIYTTSQGLCQTLHLRTLYHAGFDLHHLTGPVSDAASEDIVPCGARSTSPQRTLGTGTLAVCWLLQPNTNSLTE